MGQQKQLQDLNWGAFDHASHALHQGLATITIILL
jgi:hypothetical protein